MSNVDDGVRNGVCMYCGSGVLSSGDHVRDEPCPGPPMTNVDIGKLYGVCRRFIDLWENVYSDPKEFEPLVEELREVLAPHEHRYPWPNLEGRPHPCKTCGQPSPLTEKWEREDSDD